jgi:hypothetical protein
MVSHTVRMTSDRWQRRQCHHSSWWIMGNDIIAEEVPPTLQVCASIMLLITVGN